MQKNEPEDANVGEWRLSRNALQEKKEFKEGKRGDWNPGDWEVETLWYGRRKKPWRQSSGGIS